MNEMWHLSYPILIATAKPEEKNAFDRMLYNFTLTDLPLNPLKGTLNTQKDRS